MMYKLIIDLSKGLNDPNRTIIMPFTEEELEEQRMLKEKAIADEKANRKLEKKRSNFVTDIATKLNIDHDELAELFGVNDGDIA